MKHGRRAGLAAMQTAPKPSSQIKTLMNLKRRFLLYVVLAGAFAATTVARAGVFENLETAKEAYLFAFPMIAAYKAMYQFNIDKSSDQYKTGFNQIWNDSCLPDNQVLPGRLYDHLAYLAQLINLGAALYGDNLS